MRSKVVIPILIVFLAAIAILLWLRPSSQTNNSGQALESVIQSNSSTNELKGGNKNDSAAVPLVAPLTTPPKSAAFDRTNPESIRKYMESQNVPVEFYGKVVDQDGNPLSDVNIQVQVRHWVVIAPVAFGAEGRSVPIKGVSDASGQFELQGATGDGFDIESIQKHGYEAEPGKRTYGATGGSLENPVIFKMWSTNIHEKLIGGGKSFDIVPDGRPYFINLTDDTISESGEGDLKVWIQYTNQPVRGQLYDWSAEIDVINGGLLEEPLGSAMYEAPTDGYVPAFQLKGQIKGGQRGDIGERQFYLQLKNGQEYGQMSIGLYAPFNDQTPGLIRLSYVINPSGSRILR